MISNSNCDGWNHNCDNSIKTGTFWGNLGGKLTPIDLYVQL